MWGNQTRYVKAYRVFYLGNYGRYGYGRIWYYNKTTMA